MLAALGQTYQISKIEKALEQFSCQIWGIAAGLNSWWLLVEQSLVTEELDEVTSSWLVGCLLPEVYWLAQFDKTKNRDLKAVYQKAYEKAHQTLLAHQLTLTLNKVEVDQWRDWAIQMVVKFQRTTSAIEGRNGYLSRLHHSGRGLSESDLQVLTVIHNFDLRRADGSTAAQRFNGADFSGIISLVNRKNGGFTITQEAKKIPQCDDRDLSLFRSWLCSRNPLCNFFKTHEVKYFEQ